MVIDDDDGDDLGVLAVPEVAPARLVEAAVRVHVDSTDGGGENYTSNCSVDHVPCARYRRLDHLLLQKDEDEELKVGT